VAQLPNAKQLGRYMELAQVGLEMVAPIGLGWLVDYLVGTSPWGIVVGALLGLAGGMIHLVAIANRKEDDQAGEQAPKP